MPPRVVVLGAGGRTGAACVDALEAAGTPAVAVVRDPAKHSAALGGRSGVELAQGDVTDQEVSAWALSHCARHYHVRVHSRGEQAPGAHPTPSLIPHAPPARARSHCGGCWRAPAAPSLPPAEADT